MLYKQPLLFNIGHEFANVLSISSKWFFEKLGNEGLVRLLAAYSNKSAQAVCTFAFCEGPGYQPIIFQGRTNVTFYRHILLHLLNPTKQQGRIVPGRGSAGYGKSCSSCCILDGYLGLSGWDLIFEYKGQT